MGAHRSNIRSICLAGTAIAGVLGLMAAPAYAQEQKFELDVPSQRLDTALRAFAQQSRQQLMFAIADTKGFNAPALNGSYTADEAIGMLLAGTNLEVHRNGSGVFLIGAASDPQSGSAAGDGAEGTVQALIVTAQKREENIQDVPIAMSAFTQEALERSQVAGGPDLITQVPNMTFTKTNFSSYSIQLRGIGTQAISATVDPAVAVAFNNTPFIRNRFFEQEFYDLQRVEVLRGPQGTLYGRNATAGVVNLISQKAKLDTYEAKLSADVANYNSTRLEGMVNIPLANEMAALRIAGAWTKRDGFSTNKLTDKPIDGRDLWSTRVSLRIAPTDRLDANLIWEHFEENDDRLRSGKQLCKMDVPTEVAGFDVSNFYQVIDDFGQGGSLFSGVQANFSQGCAPASLYSPDSFQKTNPLALPYFLPLGQVSLPISQSSSGIPIDPYTSRTQSRDLRVIEAAVDPGYRAKTDVVELQFAYDLTDSLTLNSETAWGSDFIFSTQDYNRFASSPGAFGQNLSPNNTKNWLDRKIIDESGVFCDPQIGCSDRLIAMDLSTARSRQFSQELRLASDFDGPFNFSLGGNFLRYDTEDKYYVFINTLTMLAANTTRGQQTTFETDPTFWVPGVTDNRHCLPSGMNPPDYSRPQPLLLCTYIDPNPITNLNDLGHNYFLSKNPYKLMSYAVFGEAYYNLADNLKVTAGLRWTVDKKEAPLVPSWLLASLTVGYPVVETVRQEWREPTGRLAIDWKPDLAFTDQTMVYGSYAHGYKAGGMNPPPYGKTMTIASIGQFGGELVSASATHPKTFDPEFIDAFEVGAKNTLLNGSLTLNLAGFYYDYKGYQLSQIVDRSAVTTNYDATVWGLELESDWRASKNLRFGLKLGYERTKVADGMRAIDVMDRTAGQPGWVVARPFPTTPSNCVLPEWLLVGNLDYTDANPDLVNVGGKNGGNASGCEYTYLVGVDPATGAPYHPFPYRDSGIQAGERLRTDINYASWSTNPADYPCWPTAAGAPGSGNEYPGVDPACLAAMSNNGEGFFKDLSGKELPNAPHITATLTADYTLPLPQSWLMTLHTDLYYQSEAWTRIFNTEGYDKLKAYTNVNLAAIFTDEDAGWKVMAYVKNVFDKDNITGAFLNSDDSGLTTNIFLVEPRLYGLRVTKDFTGGPWWTGGDLDHKGPFPFTVELGGEIQRTDAPADPLRPASAEALPQSLTSRDVEAVGLDTGDGRSVKITYRPDGSPWHVSGSVRYGKTNRGNSDVQIDPEVHHGCVLPSDFYFAFLVCSPDAKYYTTSKYNVQVDSWSNTEARSRERHEIVDFEVGRDVGFFGGLNSTISAGLRHAQLRSEEEYNLDARFDWDVPETGWGYRAAGPDFYSSYRELHAKAKAQRKFEGAGPVVSWDAALPIWRSEKAGSANVDWRIAGGALYGERKTTVSGQSVITLHKGALPSGNIVGDNVPSILTGTLPVIQSDSLPIGGTRSDRTTVPLLDLSLGLSYEAGRMKVSTGYHWERYFDALDVGSDKAKDGDRTFDGPYLKLAIGFGG